MIRGVRPVSSKGGPMSLDGTARRHERLVMGDRGASAYLVLSVVVAVVLSATLRGLGGSASDLVEHEKWTTAPLTRELQEEQEALAERKPLSDRLGARIKISRQTRGYSSSSSKRSK